MQMCHCKGCFNLAYKGFRKCLWCLRGNKPYYSKGDEEEWWRKKRENGFVKNQG